MNENKKIGARDNFKDYAISVIGSDISSMSDKLRSRALTKYYIEKIWNATHTQIDESDFEEGYVDASYDVGVDFIHRDDGHVLILQIKYVSSDKSASFDDIHNFQSVLRRLKNIDEKKHKKLAEIATDILWDSDVFTCQFIIMGRIDGQAHEQTNAAFSLPVNTNDLVNRVSPYYFDEQKLNVELRNALEFGAGFPGDHTITAEGSTRNRSQIVEIDAGGYASYILCVSSQQIVDLYKRYRDSLFTLNIRNYIGASQTNSKIVETAKKHPDLFYHFNNGISCLVKSANVTDGGTKIVTHGIQIINGAQTVKSLVRASTSSEWKNQAKPPSILIRITEVPGGYAETGRFREDVVLYNNSQNVIKKSDFRSNDPIQVDLKNKFAKMHLHGKPIDYISKRTDTHKTMAEQIKLEEFTKTIYSFLGDPVAFAGSTSFLFNLEGGYNLVFGDGKNTWDSMPEAEFRLRSGIWWMSQSFKKQLSQDKAATEDPDDKQALERKFMLIYAARLILQRSLGDEHYKETIQRTWEGKWQFGEDKFGKFFEELYQYARDSVIYKYAEDSQRPGFNHRNWTRSKSTVEGLERYLRKAPIGKLTAI